MLPTDTAGAEDQRIERFLAAALAGDWRALAVEAQRVIDARGVPFLYEKVLRPCLAKVGDMWHTNEISVADEHLATAAVQAAIASLYPLFPWPSRREKALVACAAGERHALGARMIADQLALDGWDDVFLGADVPLDALLRKLSEVRPRLLALSATMPHYLPAAEKAIDAARAAVPGIHILVGGQAFVPGGAGRADAIAHDGIEAVEVAHAWK